MVWTVKKEGFPRMKQDLLAQMRRGESLSLRQQLLLIAQLSLPAMLAQLSVIAMEYIDASMVGHLGAGASASIGLIASSTWLMGGLCSAACTGFTVQVAQRIGAGDESGARSILRQALVIVGLFGLLLLALGASVHRILPLWLGGEPEVCRNASLYFLIFSLFLPIHQWNLLAAGMLQCSGNMKLPSLLEVGMCLLNVIFNALLIFPARTATLFGVSLRLPGAGMGVAGAALGTGLAELVIAGLMLYFLLARSPALHLRRGEPLRLIGADLTRACRIALPVAVEQVIMCGAQIVSTRIVAPLGTIAIAANSFSITVEGLCYMPGYGIGTAATTLIGQCIGARRQDLTRRLGWLTTLLGMAVMTFTGALMFLFAPFMIGLLSPDPAIRALGASVLRIEAFAEPMYAASIVASGVFRGAGDTLVPSCMNFFSMWAVRLPLAALLASRIGLRGVWIAMCIELCVRGVLFLIRLAGKRWRRCA